MDISILTHTRARDKHQIRILDVQTLGHVENIVMGEIHATHYSASILLQHRFPMATSQQLTRPVGSDRDLRQIILRHGFGHDRTKHENLRRERGQIAGLLWLITVTKKDLVL